MRVDAPKDEWIAALDTVIKAVPNKPMLPILKNILITAQGNEMKLYATDTKISIEAPMYGMPIEPGEIAVEAKLFFEIIKKMSSHGNVSVETTENSTVEIRCDKSKITIPYLVADEFPHIKVDDDGTSFVSTESDLRQAIQAISYCCENGSGANILMTGVHFNVENHQITLTALDGRRVGKRTIQTPTTSHCEAIIARDSIKVLERLLGDSTRNVCATVSDKNVMFDFNDIVLIAQTLDGKYFDTRSLFDKETICTVQTDRKRIVSALERAYTLIPSIKPQPVVFELNGNYSMRVSTRSNTGDMNEEFEVEKDGDDLRIGFNCALLLEILKSIGDDDITLCFSGQRSPLTISGEGYSYLLLPVAIREA